MNTLSLDLQSIADIVNNDVHHLQQTLNGTIKNLVRQIEPDDKNDDGSFTLYFDRPSEKVFWNPSNEDADTSELRSISVRFLEPNRYRKVIVHELEFGFVGDDSFEVSISGLRVETKQDLINVLLHRLNEQRQAKQKKKRV